MKEFRAQAKRGASKKLTALRYAEGGRVKADAKGKEARALLDKDMPYMKATGFLPKNLGAPEDTGSVSSRLDRQARKGSRP